MRKRIYISTPTASVENTRLVEAGNPAQVRNHVTKGMFNIRVATTREVADLVADGVKVETASADTE